MSSLSSQFNSGNRRESNLHHLIGLLWRLIMSPVEPKPKLSQRYMDAMIYAARLHQHQVRKNGGAPYIAHLQSVASSVLKNGGTEDEAIAAWLHDAVEDQGGWQTLQEIRDQFGENVAEIVAGCSDCFTRPTQPLPYRMMDWWRIYSHHHGPMKTSARFMLELGRALPEQLNGKRPIFPELRPPWAERKSAYIERLSNDAPYSVLLVSACDKLDNVRSLVEEYREQRENLWLKFSGGKQGTLQYFETLLQIYRERGLEKPVVQELADTLDTLLCMTNQCRSAGPGPWMNKARP